MEVLINNNIEMRTTYIWKGDDIGWVKSMGLRDVKAGDIFYMQEPDGDVVMDSKGYNIFVANFNAVPDVDSSRYKVECVPVAQDEMRI